VVQTRLFTDPRSYAETVNFERAAGSRMSRKNEAQSKAARVLIVNDEPDVCVLLSRWLTSEGYSCETANDGPMAVMLLAENKFDLVISDIIVPGMSGIDLLTIVRDLFPDAAVLILTAADHWKTAVSALDLGAYGYVIKPFDKNEILISTANALERLRLKLLRQEYERSLDTKVEDGTRQRRQREEEIVLRLISEISRMHDETRSHMRRIGLYSAAMATSLGWTPQSVQDIRLAASIHDVGKIGIPDTILLKPERLTTEEFEVMKRHTTIGAEILDGSNVPLIQMAREIALSHHEKWDGSGYPHGLIREATPESALIVGVVDVYDAMVSERPYRPALPENEALSLMRIGRDEYFDPRILDCFLDLLTEIQLIREEVGHQEVWESPSS
jgi:putative two-component system response regulator